MTMVNGERRDNIYSVSLTNKKSFDNNDPTESNLLFFFFKFCIELLDNFKLKDAKSKYNNYLFKFTNNLIKLSLNLK